MFGQAQGSGKPGGKGGDEWEKGGMGRNRGGGGAMLDTSILDLVQQQSTDLNIFRHCRSNKARKTMEPTERRLGYAVLC